MTSVLVSGAEAQVSELARALRELDADVTEVTDLADVPAVCASAGPDAFDAYVQLGASFQVEGETAIQRVRHFYADGVLARFTALDAALPSLRSSGSVLFVLGTLPAEVTTKADREARRALTEVLARAAQADASPGDLTVRILDTGTAAERVAALAVGVPPPPEPLDPRLDELSLADWRIELMNVVMIQT